MPTQEVTELEFTVLAPVTMAGDNDAVGDSDDEDEEEDKDKDKDEDEDAAPAEVA